MSDAIATVIDNPPPIEVKKFSPPVESFGASNKGGREANEDSFFTSSQGFFPAELDVGEYQELIQAEGLVKAQAKYLVDLLEGSLEFEITEEDVLGMQGHIRDLIAQGKIGGLEIVADGAGGHGSGEIAATVATLVTVQYVIRKGKEDTPITNTTLHEAITTANSAVKAVNSKIYGSDNMTTTLVAALITPDGKKAYIDSVGDSRAYSVDVKTGEGIQITDDHSLVYGALKRGELELPSKILTHHYKSVISRCLGHENGFEIQSYELELGNNKTLVLCTDGVWEDLNLKDEAVKAKIDMVDKEFQENISAGMDRGEAIRKAFGRIFREINLGKSGISFHSTRSIVEMLTTSAGQFSHDNVTALAVKLSSDHR